MIYIKSNRELELMRKSGKLVAKVLMSLAKAAVPGTKLIELDRLAEEMTLSFGAKPSFKGYIGYKHSLCASVNEQVVHGVPSERILREGDIIGLDFGLNYQGFHGDSAITVAVGNVSDEAKLLMSVTKMALYAGIDAARAGNTVRDVATAIESVVKPHSFGIVKEFVGHGIGQKLHEDPQIPNYAAGASSVKLKPGMTIAIEPMVNRGTHKVKVLADRWTAVTEDGQLSAHYEHSIAITDGEPEILTAWESVLNDPDSQELVNHLKERSKYGQRGPNPA
ncbi:MAG: type I methionyl aminopeptidase [Deltaproteobacteria bacterium]|nr:type I methionyl aminopeptidase [Deltaproteobacteria bacterium]